MDYAHTETDKRIEELEKRLQAEYRRAYKETKGKLEKYLSDFARKDEAKRKLVEKGELSQADYKKWRTNQMLTGKRWANMVDTLARDMNRTNQIAADIINGQLSPTFALNANFAEYLIEEGFRTDYGFTLYNQETVNRLVAENPDLLPAPSVDIPADIRWNKQKITSNITQAVLQGKSIPEIAKTMQTVVGMNKASATRNARTAMTGAQNAGRQKVYEDAAKRGILKRQEWVATLDGRTRHSHGMADGQRVNVGEPFIVGGYKLRCPGDPHGKAKEIYNCRCSTAPVTKYSEPRITYPEWVQTKEGQEELEKARLERNKKAAKRRKAKNKQQNNVQNGLKSGGDGGIIKSNKTPVSSFVNSSDPLYEKAKKIKPISGYQDIVIHGDKTGFSYKDKDGNETILNVSEFTKLLKESGLYKGGKIRLISCEVGADDAHTAQWFADDMGVEVLAPTDIVWIDDNGEMTIGPTPYENSGKWIVIKPNVRK